MRVSISWIRRMRRSRTLAGWRVVSAELAGGELLDVVKRQPKRLRLLDEPHLAHCRVRSHAEANLRRAGAFSSRRFS